MFKYMWIIVLVAIDILWAIFATKDIMNVYRKLNSDERKSLDMWDHNLAVDTIVF